MASLGEELGLTGFMAILALYLVVVQRALRTAIGVRDGFGKLIAVGIGFSMALQLFVVVGGVTRVIPLTGLTTPFLAYGGSSMIANWIAVAILMRISDLARASATDVSPGGGPLFSASPGRVRAPIAEPVEEPEVPETSEGSDAPAALENAEADEVEMPSDGAESEVAP